MKVRNSNFRSSDGKFECKVQMQIAYWCGIPDQIVEYDCFNDDGELLRPLPIDYDLEVKDFVNDWLNFEIDMYEMRGE